MPKSGVAEALIAHARALDRRERDSASEVSPLLDAAGDRGSRLRARLHDLAAIHFTDLSVEQALQHAERGVAVYRHHHPDEPEFADAIDTLSTVLFRQARRAEAAERSKEALTIARAQGQPAFRLAPLSPKRLSAEVALAACRARLGDVDEARQTLPVAEDAFVTLGSLGGPLRAEVQALRETLHGRRQQVRFAESAQAPRPDRCRMHAPSARTPAQGAATHTVARASTA